MPLYPGKPGNSVGPPVGGRWVKGRGVAQSGFKNLMRSAKARVYNCWSLNCSKGCEGGVAVGGVDEGGAAVKEANGGGGPAGGSGGGGGELADVCGDNCTDMMLCVDRSALGMDLNCVCFSVVFRLFI